MPTLPPGSVVELRQGVSHTFRYPPIGNTGLVIAVETAALRSRANALTTIVEGDETDITWVASLDESLLSTSGSVVSNPRARVTDLLLTGETTWQVVRPGTLRLPGHFRRDTVYQGDRPWIVVGGPHRCGLLAAPLNDLGRGTRGHYQCAILARHLRFAGAIDSKLELNHLWSFPASSPVVGSVDPEVRTAIAQAIRGYYPGRV